MLKSGSQALRFLFEEGGKVTPGSSVVSELAEEEIPPTDSMTTSYATKKDLSTRAVSFLKDLETGDGDKPSPKCAPCNICVVWDNSYSLKILGSRSAIEKEELTRQQLPHFIIHPLSKISIYWKSILLVTLLLNAVLQPVAIAFYTRLNIGWLAFNVVSDIIFLMDILFTFWTGVITDDNVIILNLKGLRKSYIQTWLTMDITNVLPFDYISFVLYTIPHTPVEPYITTSTLLTLQQLSKLLSLIKLIRVIKFMRLLIKWQEIFFTSWSVSNMINFVFGVLLLCHCNGCIQYLIVYLEDFPPVSWVAINNLQDASIGSIYSYAIFKAFSHMLCIGYGQRPPRGTTDVWVTIISMLIGATLYAMFIGHITSLIYSSTSSSRLYSEKLKLVEEYMKYHKLPQSLKIKVRDYFYHRYHGRLFNETSMLKELSHVLEEEINRFHYQDVIRLVPIFKDVDDSFISAITSMFSFEVFLEGDYIISYNSIGTTMYFIQHGEAHVINCKGEPIKTLVDGDYFGEISLLLNERRQGSVRALTVCFVFCLERDCLNSVLNRFPNLRASMEIRARERLQELYRSEDRSPDHILSVFSERLTESETLGSESVNDSLSGDSFGIPGKKLSPSYGRHIQHSHTTSMSSMRTGSTGSRRSHRKRNQSRTSFSSIAPDKSGGTTKTKHIHHGRSPSVFL